MVRLADKDTFKRVQLAGLLGNYFRMWDTVDEMGRADYGDHITIRARTASNRELFVPVVYAYHLWAMGECINHPRRKLMRYPTDCEICRALWIVKHRAGDVYFQECPAPEAGRIINLEAALTPCPWNQPGLYVRYTLNDPTNLRHSLEQRGADVTGLRAWHLLRHYLGTDVEQLEGIWDQWPGAVIEASRFTRRVGVLDSQTIIWEAREF